jgi:hypothetical protein
MAFRRAKGTKDVRVETNVKYTAYKKEQWDNICVKFSRVVRKYFISNVYCIRLKVNMKNVITVIVVS